MLILWCWLIRRDKKIIQSGICFPASWLQQIPKNRLAKLVEVFIFTISDPRSHLGVSTLHPAFGGVSRGRPLSEVCAAKLLAEWYNFFVFYTYILLLRDGTYYQGYSDNLKQRFKEHQRGIVESTKNFRPVKLVFYAAFQTKEKAISFEKYLKSSSGFAFRNKRLI